MFVRKDREPLGQGLPRRQPILGAVERIGPVAVGVHGEAPVPPRLIRAEEVGNAILIAGVEVARDPCAVLVDAAVQVARDHGRVIGITNKDPHVLPVLSALRIARHHGQVIEILDFEIRRGLEPYVAVGVDRERGGILAFQRPGQGVTQIMVACRCRVDNGADIRILDDRAERQRNDLWRIIGAVDGDADLLRRRTILGAHSEGVGMRRAGFQALNITIGNQIGPLTVTTDLQITPRTGS